MSNVGGRLELEPSARSRTASNDAPTVGAPSRGVLRTNDAQTSVVEGQVRVEDVNEELDLNIPAGDYETLAGFLLARMGRLPSNGDTLIYNGTRLTVLEMQGPRIKRIEIKRAP